MTTTIPKQPWDFLGDYAEEVPLWLQEYKPGDTIKVEAICDSRVGYYPGAGDDGSLIKCCNMAHCAHLFVMADYMYGDNDWFDEISLKKAKGYDVIGDFDLPDLSAREIEYHVPIETLREGAPKTARFPGAYTPWFNMVVYQRQPQYGDGLGAERFAVIFARYDGIALYDILFGSGLFSNLFIILNQEHGFGGNYDRYVRLMQRIAVNSGVLPKFILTEDCNLWDNYTKVETEPMVGGMHRNRRYIYRHNHG